MKGARFMKLIRVFAKGVIPGISEVGPIDGDRAVLVTDAKYRLLQLNNVNMMLIKSYKFEFAEYPLDFKPRNGNTAEFIIDKLVKKTSDVETAVSSLEEGDIIMASNFDDVIDDQPEDRIYKVEGGKAIPILDLTEYAYKQIENFALNGTYPWERGYNYKVTASVGSFKSGDSLKGMTIIEIIEKMLTDGPIASEEEVLELKAIIESSTTLVSTIKALYDDETYTSDSRQTFKTTMDAKITSTKIETLVEAAKKVVNVTIDDVIPKSDVKEQMDALKPAHDELMTAFETASESLVEETV